MKKHNDSERFICRDAKETEAYNKNKREDRTVTREHVREVVDKIVREHRPALDWLADK